MLFANIVKIKLELMSADIHLQAKAMDKRAEHSNAPGVANASGVAEEDDVDVDAVDGAAGRPSQQQSRRRITGSFQGERPKPSAAGVETAYEVGDKDELVRACLTVGVLLQR
jgi:hypothetical protein